MHQPVVHQIVVAEINFVDNVINHASRLFQTGTLQTHIGQCFGINADFAADIYHVHIPVMPFIGRIPQIRAGIDTPDCEMSACGRIVVRSFEEKDFFRRFGCRGNVDIQLAGAGNIAVDNQFVGCSV